MLSMIFVSSVFDVTATLLGRIIFWSFLPQRILQSGNMILFWHTIIFHNSSFGSIFIYYQVDLCLVWVCGALGAFYPFKIQRQEHRSGFSDRVDGSFLLMPKWDFFSIGQKYRPTKILKPLDRHVLSVLNLAIVVIMNRMIVFVW